MAAGGWICQAMTLDRRGYPHIIRSAHKEVSSASSGKTQTIEFEGVRIRGDRLVRSACLADVGKHTSAICIFALDRAWWG